MKQTAITGNKGDRVRSDCQVTLQLPEKGGISITLKSKVEAMFGEQIRQQAEEVLKTLGISHAHLEIEDNGALPFVIGARIEAAVNQLQPTGHSWIPPLIEQNRDDSGKERFRFSRLYLPGNSPAMMLNAGIHQPEGIILDLEDSVAPEKKAEARLLVRNALCQVDFYGAERMVRINQLPAGLEDLDEVVPRQLHLVLLPKCEHASQVAEVTERIDSVLLKHKQEREIFLMPIIESCLGVENAFEIARASESVVAMAIGLEDYTADLGVKRTDSGEESLYARTRLVNACKAAGIQPIDSVFSDVADMEGLKRNVATSRSLGFEGMGCIHPRQVPVIQEAFVPGENEIKDARRIVEAFEKAEARGSAVVALGSKMIDPPVVKRALKILDLACKLKP
ncbi:MAG: HpcH/HpaI aldolase/citrate lyase family protein [Bacteroidetes bacterium]|nr:HpcH/HpaI aldolase/citrate lyase family protein [Bacteroidota bacterium]